MLATSRLCLARNKSFNFTAKHWGFSLSLRTPLGKLFNNEGLRFERCKRTRTLNEAFEVQVIGFNPSDRQTHQKAYWRFSVSFPPFPSLVAPFPTSSFTFPYLLSPSLLPSPALLFISSIYPLSPSFPPSLSLNLPYLSSSSILLPSPFPFCTFPNFISFPPSLLSIHHSLPLSLSLTTHHSLPLSPPLPNTPPLSPP